MSIPMKWKLKSRQCSSLTNVSNLHGNISIIGFILKETELQKTSIEILIKVGLNSFMFSFVLIMGLGGND